MLVKGDKMMKIQPPEGYEWCALYDADCDERGYALQAAVIPKLGNIEPSFFVSFGKPPELEACRVGHLRRKPPELPQEITDAGWEYAASWDDAQKAGKKGENEARCGAFTRHEWVVIAQKEAENWDSFICWLKVKK